MLCQFVAQEAKEGGHSDSTPPAWQARHTRPGGAAVMTINAAYSRSGQRLRLSSRARVPRHLGLEPWSSRRLRRKGNWPGARELGTGGPRGTGECHRDKSAKV
eukprot:2945689-Rhodomonas_salina.1